MVHITARKHAEQALAASEQKYRSMVSALSEGVLIFTVDYKLTACNPAAERILGVTFDDMVKSHNNLSDWSCLRPDMSPFPLSEWPLVQTVVTGKAVHGVAMGYVTSRGILRWLRVNSEPVVAPDTGKLDRVVVSLTDVTATYAAEQERLQLSLAVSQSPNSILIIDGEGHIQYANEAFERASGFSLEEVRGSDLRMFRTGCQETTPLGTLWEALSEGRDWRGEVLCLRRDGSTRLNDIRAAPIRRPGHKITLFLITAEDIHTARQLELELEQHRHHLEELVAAPTAELERSTEARKKAERFLLTITNHIPSIIAYWDKQLQLKFINRTHFEWYGKTPDQTNDMTLNELLGDDAVQLRPLVLTSMFKGESRRLEHHLVKHSGESIEAWSHYIPDIQDGEVVGFFVKISDVTDLKRAEWRLKELNEALTLARDKAEEANRAKSGFLANMSLEIRTPLNAIIGLTHLLDRETPPGTQKERLKKIAEAAHHLLQVINNILDISKIESGKLNLESMDFVVEEMLSSTISLVAEQARKKGLELILQTGQLPGTLGGDRTRVSQALLNLLSNAVKFTGQGLIVLSCRVQAMTAQHTTRRLEVRDTGCGIPADQISRLFTAFEQLDSSTSRRYEGTGLGLAITRHLAELMGGTVGVESKVGVGTCFWFTVTLTNTIPVGPLVKTPLFPGRRALLIDDVAEAREAIETMLRRLGLCLVAVSSGEEALMLVDMQTKAGMPYELIIIDRDLPDMAALPLAGQLRELTHPLPPHTLLLSIQDDAQLRQEARAAHIQQVLLKPITLPALQDALHGLLDDGSEPEPHTLLERQSEALLHSYQGSYILLAEDNMVNREVATELLTSIGMHVEVAENGKEAIAQVMAHRYDLILMDVQMPEMDGLTATRQLRGLPNGATVPILAMTANAFNEDRTACLSAGMNAHVAKPVDPQALYEALLRWLPLKANAERPAPAHRQTRPAG